MTVLSTSQEESKRRQTRGPTRRQVPFHPPDDPPSKPPHHDPGAVEADPIVENARHGPLPRSTGLMRTLTHIRPHEPILARKRRVNPSGRSSAQDHPGLCERRAVTVARTPKFAVPGVVNACLTLGRRRSRQQMGENSADRPEARGQARHVILPGWVHLPRSTSTPASAVRPAILHCGYDDVETVRNSGSGRDPSRVGGPVAGAPNGWAAHTTPVPIRYHLTRQRGPIVPGA